MQYYHYTSTAGANAIRNEGIIRSQNSAVKLSTLKPEDYSRDEILRNIYGNRIPARFKNAADNVIFVAESDLDSSKLISITSTLYQYDGDINVSASDVQDKPRCGNSASGWNGSSSSSSSGWKASQANPLNLVYYTNTSNANLIMHSGCIPLNGKSIYLTTMQPEDYFRDEILNAIYGKTYDRREYASFADWCVKIKDKALDASRLKQINGKVYEYTDSIRIDVSDVMDKPRCKNSGKAGFDAAQEYLYHYTNSQGAANIKAAGFLKKSGASGAFGTGVYMTNLKPTDFFRDDILKNNYGGIYDAFKGRADWMVRVKKTNLVDAKLKSIGPSVTNDDSRQIFVYGDIVDVQATDVMLKPKCYRAEK